MARITIHLKRLGKKKVYPIPLTLDTPTHTLEALIRVCVHNEVTQFNEKRTQSQLLPFLTPAAIQEQSGKGKIGFGDSPNPDKAVLSQSIANAIQGFKDGLFLVFIDEQEIKSLDEKIILHPNSTITFLRMTFLTGTYW